MQYLLEPTPKRDVLFIIEARNAKAGIQEISGVRGKSDLMMKGKMKQGKG